MSTCIRRFGRAAPFNSAQPLTSPISPQHTDRLQKRKGFELARTVRTTLSFTRNPDLTIMRTPKQHSQSRKLDKYVDDWSAIRVCVRIRRTIEGNSRVWTLLFPEQRLMSVAKTNTSIQNTLQSLNRAPVCGPLTLVRDHEQLFKRTPIPKVQPQSVTYQERPDRNVV